MDGSALPGGVLVQFWMDPKMRESKTKTPAMKPFVARSIPEFVGVSFTDLFHWLANYDSISVPPSHDKSDPTAGPAQEFHSTFLRHLNSLRPDSEPIEFALETPVMCPIPMGFKLPKNALRATFQGVDCRQWSESDGETVRAFFAKEKGKANRLVRLVRWCVQRDSLVESARTLCLQFMVDSKELPKDWLTNNLLKTYIPRWPLTTAADLERWLTDFRESREELNDKLNRTLETMIEAANVWLDDREYGFAERKDLAVPRRSKMDGEEANYRRGLAAYLQELQPIIAGLKAREVTDAKAVRPGVSVDDPQRRDDTPSGDELKRARDIVEKSPRITRDDLRVRMRVGSPKASAILRILRDQGLHKGPNRKVTRKG